MHRRSALLGLTAGIAAWPPASRTAVADVASQPAAEGPLSTPVVTDLLKRHNVPGASLAIVEKGGLVATCSYAFAPAIRRPDRDS